MSRRDARDQETTAFLQQNPSFIEYNTQIAPAQDDKGRFVLEITQDDNDPVQTEAPGFSLLPPQGALPDLISVGGDQEAPGAEVEASYETRRGLKEASVAVSELGIGVTSGGDMKDFIKELLKGDLGPEDLVKFATISDGENLEVEVDDEAPEGAVVPDSEGFPFLELSGREVGIGFDVISGSGKIQITLIDANTGEPETIEFDTFVAGATRRPSTVEIDHIMAQMSDGGQFDAIMISTTGDLEITVTGIDLVSGYSEGMMLYPV